MKNKQTTASPLVSYVATFATTDKSFYANQNAATNQVAYFDNTGRRMVWEAKFCTAALRDLMREEKVNVVSGELVSPAGQMQFAALCVQK